MKKLHFTFLILISLIVISCGGKDDGGGGNVDPPDPINPPTSTTLVSPANNTECLRKTPQKFSISFTRW